MELKLSGIRALCTLRMTPVAVMSRSKWMFSPTNSKNSTTRRWRYSLFDGAGKQLDMVAKHYDLFRASLRLPVVPGNVAVVVPCVGKHKVEQWYRQLTFHNDMSENKAALLKQTNVLVKGKQKRNPRVWLLLSHQHLQSSVGRPIPCFCFGRSMQQQSCASVLGR
jgi:hypothetical protein